METVLEYLWRTLTLTLSPTSMSRVLSAPFFVTG
jgi:hypothetical protein